MEMNLERYILCVGVNGEPIYSEEGNIYVSNIDDNTMVQLQLTEEISKHFGIEKCVGTIDSPNDSEEMSGSGSWNSAGIKNLIELYKKNEKLFKNTSLKKQKVWNIIAAAMKENGYFYKPTQCENKFKYLKARYTKKKDNMGDRGTGKSPIKFEFYEELGDIFGKKPNITPIISSSIPQCSKNENIENKEPPTAKKENQGPTEKRRRVEESNTEKEQNKILTFMQERDEERERRHQENLKEARETRKIYADMMQKLIEKL